MQDTGLTNEQSLKIITEMISKAKSNVARRGSFYFLLWGWVLLFGNLGYYLASKFEWLAAPHWVWIITLPAIVITIVHGMRQDGSSSGSAGKLDNIYMNLWAAIGVALITVLAFMYKLEFNHNAIILLLAAIGTYVTGKLIKFSPFFLGSLGLWIGAVVAFNLPVLDQYLVGAIAIVIGYLIPGYLLKKEERG